MTTTARTTRHQFVTKCEPSLNITDCIKTVITSVDILEKLLASVAL